MKQKKGLGMNLKIIKEKISMSTNSLQRTLKALFFYQVGLSTINASSSQLGLSLSINTNPHTHKTRIYTLHRIQRTLQAYHNTT